VKRKVKESWSQRIRRTKKWAKWRMAVYKRDNFTCQLCGRKGPRTRLEPHHIYPKARYKKKVFDVDNGITLCRKCHRYTPGLHKKGLPLSKKLRAIVESKKKGKTRFVRKKRITSRSRKRIRGFKH